MPYSWGWETHSRLRASPGLPSGSHLAAQAVPHTPPDCYTGSPRAEVSPVPSGVASARLEQHPAPRKYLTETSWMGMNFLCSWVVQRPWSSPVEQETGKQGSVSPLHCSEYSGHAEPLAHLLEWEQSQEGAVWLAVRGRGAQHVQTPLFLTFH